MDLYNNPYIMPAYTLIMVPMSVRSCVVKGGSESGLGFRASVTHKDILSTL